MCEASVFQKSLSLTISPRPTPSHTVHTSPHRSTPPYPQEWNEIQFNGVQWQPEEAGAPGEVDPDKTYTFKYPRPDK